MSDLRILPGRSLSLRRRLTWVKAISAIGETWRQTWKSGTASVTTNSSLSLFRRPKSKPFMAQCGYLAAWRIILLYARALSVTSAMAFACFDDLVIKCFFAEWINGKLFPNRTKFNWSAKVQLKPSHWLIVVMSAVAVSSAGLDGYVGC